MSTINTVIDRLDLLLSNFAFDKNTSSELTEIRDMLTDPTVLLLEWNAIDVQTKAREKIAFLNDVEIEEVIENPLSREDVEWVISRLDKYYDCNYGITWDSISSALEDITLPDAENCLIKKENVCEWTGEIGCEGIYETDCGNTYDFGELCSKGERFIYCPYCGKEIKDVGDQEKE